MKTNRLYPSVIVGYKSTKKDAIITAVLTFVTQFTHLHFTAAERDAQAELDALLADFR